VALTEGLKVVTRRILGATRVGLLPWSPPARVTVVAGKAGIGVEPAIASYLRSWVALQVSFVGLLGLGLGVTHFLKRVAMVGPMGHWCWSGRWGFSMGVTRLMFDDGWVLWVAGFWLLLVGSLFLLPRVVSPGWLLVPSGQQPIALL